MLLLMGTKHRDRFWALTFANYVIIIVADSHHSNYLPVQMKTSLEDKTSQPTA